MPVRLRHATRSAEVTAAVTTDRFQVVLRTRTVTAATGARPARTTEPPSGDPPWLAEIPEGARAVFKHLAAHGSINEHEATQLLGGPRQFRVFSRNLETYAARAPFPIRVDVSAGTKCYVRGDS